MTAMTRTQIYITDDEKRKLRKLSRQSGRRQSELVRKAIDEYLERTSTPLKNQLGKYRGMWQDKDVSEVSQVRKEVEKRLNEK